MTAYTFLGRGAIDPLEGRSRQVGEWAPLPRCVVGAARLVDGIGDELWVVEVDGARARLVRRVDEWDAEAARVFATSCVESACAVAGLPYDERTVIEAAEQDPRELVAFAADSFALARGRRPEEWREPSLEALAPSPGAIAGNLGFVVAHAAGRGAELSGRSYSDGFESERARQQSWLTERLGFLDD